MPAWLRSTLITFAVTFAGIVAVTDFAWTRDAIIAALVTATRTAVSALAPGGPFGFDPDGGDGEDDRGMAGEAL